MEPFGFGTVVLLAVDLLGVEVVVMPGVRASPSAINQPPER